MAHGHTSSVSQVMFKLNESQKIFLCFPLKMESLQAIMLQINSLCGVFAFQVLILFKLLLLEKKV